MHLHTYLSRGNVLAAPSVGPPLLYFDGSTYDLTSGSLGLPVLLSFLATELALRMFWMMACEWKRCTPCLSYVLKRQKGAEGRGHVLLKMCPSPPFLLLKFGFILLFWIHWVDLSQPSFNNYEALLYALRFSQFMQNIRLFAIYETIYCSFTM